MRSSKQDELVRSQQKQHLFEMATELHVGETSEEAGKGLRKSPLPARAVDNTNRDCHLFSLTLPAKSLQLVGCWYRSTGPSSGTYLRDDHCRLLAPPSYNKLRRLAVAVGSG